MKKTLIGSHVYLSPFNVDDYPDIDFEEYMVHTYIVEVAPKGNDYVVECHYRDYIGDTDAMIEANKEFGTYNVVEFYKVA